MYAPSLRRLTYVLTGACALIFGGCAFFPGAKPAPSEVILDPTPRPATTQVEVLRDEPGRRHRVIAELEVSYDSKDGGAPVDELVKRAKSLGAHAIILAPSKTTWRVTSQKGALDEYTPADSERFPATTLRSRSLFSARAIVFE